jgi:hypothetical protein
MEPRKADTEEMLTMAPPFARIFGTAARLSR